MLFSLTWRKFYTVQNTLSSWANSALPSLQQSLLFYQRHLSSFFLCQWTTDPAVNFVINGFHISVQLGYFKYMSGRQCPLQIYRSTICRSDQKRRTTENNNKDTNLNYTRLKGKKYLDSRWKFLQRRSDEPWNLLVFSISCLPPIACCYCDREDLGSYWSCAKVTNFLRPDLKFCSDFKAFCFTASEKPKLCVISWQHVIAWLTFSSASKLYRGKGCCAHWCGRLLLITKVRSSGGWTRFEVHQWAWIKFDLVRFDVWINCRS